MAEHEGAQTGSAAAAAGSGELELSGTTPLSMAAAERLETGAAPQTSGSAVGTDTVPRPEGPGSRARRLPEVGRHKAPPAASGDELWATTFGAVNVAAYPTEIAVHGDQVYLGGTFTVEMAGLPNDTFLRVARWDGSSWRRMGDGVDAEVHAITVVGNDVYVGGEFSVAGGLPAARLARWDGSGWSEVAGGVSASQSWVPVAVRALASDGSSLYVAGTFDSVGSGAGAIEARGFAALDLTTGVWRSYDGGLHFAADPGEGRALALVGRRLLVGGSFDRAGTVETAALAALDLGTGSWEGFGAGLRNGDFAGTVDGLAVDETSGTVYVGGRFTAAGELATSGVATLTGGEFGSLGGFTYYGDPGGANIVAIAYAGGRVYAAGVFTTAGEVEAQHWVANDGSGWRVPAAVDNGVSALAAYGDGVVVAGTFGVSDELRIPHAAIWTGTRWQTFGQGVGHDPASSPHVYALVATDQGVYAGGYFDQAGAVRVASVAHWRDGAWQDMAGGVQSPHVLGEVFAMLAVGGDLYVTGQFETAGGVAAANIARWDGEQWWPLGGGIQGIGYALTMLDGRLYVGGGFYRAEDVHVSNIASWDPATSTWSAVGSVPTYDGDVFALAVLDDRYLVVGGEFSKLWTGHFQVSGLNALVLFDTHAPAEPANPWAGYSRVPGVTKSGWPGVVSTLQVLGQELYVGGHFDTAGVEARADPPVAGFAASNLATWHFRPPGRWSAPAGPDRQVKALATLDGRSLVVGGGFGSAGGVEAAAVAEHDPATGSWTPYGSGIGWGSRGIRQVEALAQSGAAGLWVGGVFTVAGGVPSCGLALWRGTAGRTPLGGAG